MSLHDEREDRAHIVPELAFGDFRHAVSDAVVALDMHSAQQESFRGAIDAATAGDIHVFHIDADTHAVHRTPGLIARAPQRFYKLSLIESGSGIIVQDGRETALGPGDMAIYDTDRPYSLVFDDAVRMSVVMFPKSMLDVPNETVLPITATLLNADAATASMIRPFVAELAQGASTLDPHVARRLMRNAVDTPLEPEVVFEAGEARAELHYDALGVVGAIGPWNWPMMITVWQIAPSLRMGNTVVAKPSEYTPLSVLALAEIYNRHLPAGVLTVVSGDREVGAAIAGHTGLDKIMFTGSTATGRKIVESSAHNLARLTLELGGNDAGIVLPGTDVAKIAQDLFWGCFINTGQTCAALKRLYVHDSQYDEVVDALAGLAQAMPMGNGLEEGNVLGPLQNQQQFDIVSRLVDEARAAGGRVVVGGEAAAELGPLFYRATVVADVTDGDALVDEEQFGPAIPVIRYTDVDDAVRRANASEQGLGASVWGDVDQAKEVARRIQAGTVWINNHGALNPQVPFGGIKASGYGMEFGVTGLKAVAAPKVISV